jgi:hypothetical protein
LQIVATASATRAATATSSSSFCTLWQSDLQHTKLRNAAVDNAVSRWSKWLAWIITAKLSSKSDRLKGALTTNFFRFPHRDYLWNYIYRISLNVQNIGKVTSQGLVGQHGGAFLVFHTGTFLKGKQLS